MIQPSRRNGTVSRQALLSHALTLAGGSGLHVASIGALAARLGMSKSGVFAHFGSKDALDDAVVQAAAEQFARAVSQPADAAPSGVARLAALVEGWLGEVEGQSPALALLVAGAPARGSAAADRLARWRAAWRTTLVAQVDGARRAGELAAGTDAPLVAFEIDALLAGASRDGGTAGAAARRAIEIRLEHLAAGR